MPIDLEDAPTLQLANAAFIQAFTVEVQDATVNARVEADLCHYTRARILGEMYRVCVEVVKIILTIVLLLLELLMLLWVEVPNPR